jgi:hypothetical protein
MRGSRHPGTIVIMIMITIMIVSGMCCGQRQIVLGVGSGQR